MKLGKLGHGRVVQDQVRATTALNAYLQAFGWPKVGQCLCIQRRSLRTTSGVETGHTHYAIADLTPQKAPARRAFGWGHGYRQIENCGHWVRDVEFGEDRCSARRRQAPRAWVVLRDIVIGLLRFCGARSIAQARAALAFSPERAASIIGIPLD
ncbi:MAG: hypothetical protein RML99_04510 [Anaerolineae bacterium]|nr:hypothetical protein [Anaerolineae bacterium]